QPAGGGARGMGRAESGGFEEPEMEPGRVVDAAHPVGVGGAPEPRVRRRPHGEALGNLIEPARPAAVTAGAVEHQQRRALTTDPRVSAGTAYRDPLPTSSHPPYSPPAILP